MTDSSDSWQSLEVNYGDAKCPSCGEEITTTKLMRSDSERWQDLVGTCSGCGTASRFRTRKKRWLERLGSYAIINRFWRVALAVCITGLMCALAAVLIPLGQAIYVHRFDLFTGASIWRIVMPLLFTVAGLSLLAFFCIFFRGFDGAPNWRCNAVNSRRSWLVSNRILPNHW